jgi:hypothetical protein
MEMWKQMKYSEIPKEKYQFDGTNYQNYWDHRLI